jgi:hypothetical protein
VEPHLSPVRLGQGLPRDNLEEEHQLEAVPKVLLDVLDLGAGLAEVRVDPGGEGLKRANFEFLRYSFLADNDAPFSGKRNSTPSISLKR